MLDFIELGDVCLLLMEEEIKKSPPKKKVKKPTAKKKKDVKPKSIASLNTPPDDNPYPKLTVLQWQTVWLLLTGMEVKDVAKKLQIHEHTIYNWKSRNDQAGINFREAIKEEIKARNEHAREEAKGIISDAFIVLRQWMTSLKKRNGFVDPKHISNVMSMLNSSKFMFKDESQVEEDKKKQELLTAFEQFVREEITNAQINSQG